MNYDGITTEGAFDDLFDRHQYLEDRLDDDHDDNVYTMRFASRALDGDTSIP